MGPLILFALQPAPLEYGLAMPPGIATVQNLAFEQALDRADHHTVVLTKDFTMLAWGVTGSEDLADLYATATLAKAERVQDESRLPMSVELLWLAGDHGRSAEVRMWMARNPDSAAYPGVGWTLAALYDHQCATMKSEAVLADLQEHHPWDEWTRSALELHEGRDCG